MGSIAATVLVHFAMLASPSLDRRGLLKTAGGAVLATAVPAPPLAMPEPISRPSPSGKSISGELAAWASSLRCDALSAEAVHHTKRFLLDALGCALGGFRQHEVAVTLDVLREVAAQGIDAVWKLEDADNVSALVELLRVRPA